MHLRTSGLIASYTPEIVIPLDVGDSLFKLFVQGTRGDGRNLFATFSPDGGATRFNNSGDYRVAYVEGAFQSDPATFGENFDNARAQLVSQSQSASADFAMVMEVLIDPGAADIKATIRSETMFMGTEEKIGIQTWCSRLLTVGRQDTLILQAGSGDLNAGSWWLYGLPTPV